MRKIFLLIIFPVMCCAAKAQVVHKKLEDAVKQLLGDEQLKHAIVGFYVINSKTNEVVYELNSSTGLAPASTQKIFTSVATLDILGKDYHYKTDLGYSGNIKNGLLNGNLLITGYGDPSFGSWRFDHTKRDTILKQFVSAIQAAGIRHINGDIILNDTKFSYQPLPGGYPWEDIGNYYGAGTWGINWNENQYDLYLKPGTKEGDETEVIGTNPDLPVYDLNNQIKTGPGGSGDNAYIYTAPYSVSGFANGTVPAGEKKFTISGSIPYPAEQFGLELGDHLKNKGITISGEIVPGAKFTNDKKSIPAITQSLYTYYSPSLDSLIYWFLQKSINLYGEAFAKTIAYEKTDFGSTDKGVDIIRTFWQQNGIEKNSVKMIDGSGLSPQNRVTATAEVAALQCAKTKPWFSSFYNALPIFNGMKMKSGTIGGAKAFAGYQTASDGTEYTFSLIINNYDGGVDAVVQKMYTLLDALK